MFYFGDEFNVSGWCDKENDIFVYFFFFNYFWLF